METMESVRNQFNNELKQLQERYRKALEELLKTNGLDKRVIRIKDGKEGVLAVESDWEKRLGYGINFYPVTKSGKASLRKSGMVWGLSEYKAKSE